MESYLNQNVCTYLARQPINYLLDLAVRFAQSGKVRKQIVALNFHHWCKRVAILSGHYTDYKELWKDDNNGHILQNIMADKTAKWLDDLDESSRWDAIFLDEGQDFELSWWTTLRKALIRDGKGEVLLCADKVQNIYGIKPWTEEKMTGAGFTGIWMSLEVCFRMPRSLCVLTQEYINKFLPDIENLRPEPPQGSLDFVNTLKWWQVPADVAAQACFDAMIDIIVTSNPPISYADLVCIVENRRIGHAVVKLLGASEIRSINTFGSGDTED